MKSPNAIGRRLAVLANTLTVIIAIAGASFWVARRFRDPRTESPSNARLARVKDWPAARRAAISLDTTIRDLNLVVFMDFECPACRKADSLLTMLPRTLRDSIHISLAHYPLPSHRFSIPSARASDCAARQNRFGDYSKLLFERQDSLGLIPFEEIARRAGVKDIQRFHACASRRDTAPSIALGIRTGEQLGLTATPTIILNGWMLGAVDLQPDSLRDRIKRIAHQ
jgi:protein-disulfide isomerase